jgi:tetratricopeptide (TPR) repeat protein
MSVRNSALTSTLLIILSFVSRAADVEGNSRYAKAVAALNEGDSATAVKEFNLLVKEKPAEPEARVGLISAYLKGGHPALAEEQVKQILAIQAADFPVLMHLERVLVQAGQLQAGIEVLKAAERQAPQKIGDEDTSVYFEKRLAALYSGVQRNEEATKALQQAIQEQPNNPENYYRLVLILIRTGSLGEAYDLAVKARVKFSDSSQITLSYALACFFAGHNEDAESAYQQLVSMDPDSDQPYFAQGNYYQDVNRTAEAAEAFATAIRKNPQNYLNFYMYGVSLFKLEKLNDAGAALRKALSLNSRHADSWYWLGRIGLRLQKKDEALDDFERTIALEPRHLAAHYQLALLYAQKGDQAKSKEMFRIWHELNGLAEHNVVAEKMQ